MGLWDTSLPSSYLSGFPNKVTIPCPNHVLPLDSLAYHGGSSMNLAVQSLSRV